MNAAAQPLAEAEVIEPGADLAIIPRETALSVLTNAEEFDAFYLRVKAIVDAHVPDVTTAKGRDAIKALAFKVVKSKTAIDAAGKGLTEEWRAQTTKVDAARKLIRDKLDILRDEARKPLSDWEAAEEARVAACEAALDRFKAAAVVAMGESAAEVSGRLADLEAETLEPKLFGDLMPIAEAASAHAKMILQAAVARLTQEEADRAELERLRQEAKAREEREAADRAEAEAAQQRRDYALAIIQHIRDCGVGLIGGQPQPYGILLRELEEKVVVDGSFGDLQAEARQVLADTLAKLKADMARQAEERRAREAEEQAERERQAAASGAREADERARAEERQKAEEAAAAAQREARAQIDEERRQREVAQAEAKRLADEKAAAEQKAAAEKAEADRRAANVAHRGKVMATAKTALMAAGGIGEDAAKKIVLAIKAGEIPAVSMQF